MNNAKPPAPPDPASIAAAQGTANVAAAGKQQQFNMVDQVTPQGSLTYAQTGTWADGTPKYEARQSLTPAGQMAFDQEQNADVAMNQIALNQAGAVAGRLSSPLKLGNEATEARLFSLGSKRLDPMFARQRDSMDTMLANRGITMGSQAWNSAYGAQGEKENDAYNQLLLTGRGQAVDEMLTERNQPIQEITALLNGGRIAQPNYVSTPTAGVTPAPIADLTSQQYAAGMDIYKQKMAQQNAMIGALAGLGGAATSAAMGGWTRPGGRFA